MEDIGLKKTPSNQNLDFSLLEATLSDLQSRATTQADIEAVKHMMEVLEFRRYHDEFPIAKDLDIVVQSVDYGGDFFEIEDLRDAAHAPTFKELSFAYLVGPESTTPAPPEPLLHSGKSKYLQDGQLRHLPRRYTQADDA